MKKLTIRLVKFERGVAGQILFQAQELYYVKYDTRPFTIRSDYNFPQFGDFLRNDIHIRGNNGADNYVIMNKDLRTNRQRDSFYNKVVASFKDLAKQLGLKFRQDGEYIYLEGE